MMNIDITVDEQASVEPVGDLADILERAGEAALEQDGFLYDVSVGLLLTDDAGIHRINRDMRGVDRPTDVLSFPLIRFATLDKSAYVPKRSQMDVDTGAVALGDVAISVQRARAQALEYGHSFTREIVYLFVHSIAHLLGYDHMTEADKRKMRVLEESALSKINLTR